MKHSLVKTKVHTPLKMNAAMIKKTNNKKGEQQMMRYHSPRYVSDTIPVLPATDRHGGSSYYNIVYHRNASASASECRDDFFVETTSTYTHGTGRDDERIASKEIVVFAEANHSMTETTPPTRIVYDKKKKVGSSSRRTAFSKLDDEDEDIDATHVAAACDVLLDFIQFFMC